MKSLDQRLDEALALETKCPKCGTEGAYVGLNDVECQNPNCDQYKYDPTAQTSTMTSNILQKLRKVGFSIIRSASRASDDAQIYYFKDRLNANGVIVCYDNGDQYVVAATRASNSATILPVPYVLADQSHNSPYIQEVDFFVNIFDPSSGVYQEIQPNDPLVQAANNIPSARMTPQEEQLYDNLV